MLRQESRRYDDSRDDAKFINLDGLQPTPISISFNIVGK